MAVAWIGSREASLEDALGEAATLLAASDCPVFSIDSDVHAARAALSLARQVGAVCDCPDAGRTAAEAAFLNQAGGIFVTPGETRRRADLLVVLGDLPAHGWKLCADLAGSTADLSGGVPRRFSTVGQDGGPLSGTGVPGLSVASAGDDLACVLAALRAVLAGRRVTREPDNIAALATALKEARYPVLVASGHGLGAMEMEMAQGIVSDLNEKWRAAMLLIPSSETGWGASLAATWMTGFPLRVSLAGETTRFDPWVFDVTRMVSEGEADLHLWIAPDTSAPPSGNARLITLTTSDAPQPEVAVSIRVGVPGRDHSAAMFTSETGTFVACPAGAPSMLPSAARVLRAITDRLSAGTESLCSSG